MKTLKFFLLTLLAIGMVTACSENNTPAEKRELTDTKWKLTSFVTGGNTKTPEQDSNNRYWLIFKDDNTLEGRSSTNGLFGSYEINTQTSSLLITNLGGSKIYELPDGGLFVESLMAVRSFNIQDSTLKLYYNETDYLLFNSDPEFVNPYRETIVGFWKLQNAVYNYDNEREESVEFNDNPVVYEFTDKNKLIVTGSESILPDNISIPAGEHDYTYQKPNVGIPALPAPNFRIDQGEPLFCLALANDNIMTQGGEKFDSQSGKIFRWNKTFIKQD
jgi:hypothetical protein